MKVADVLEPTDAGTVEVEMLVDRTPAAVWRALTDPQHLSRWFGELSGTLKAGQHARFEFGDGDFFAVVVREVDPGRRLGYQWRFMGVGPRDQVTWTIAEGGEGTVVRVRDHNPERTAEEAEVLSEGWRDFTRRLVGFLHTGAPTRYDWRRDLDASIQLSSSLERAREVLFTSPWTAGWLPFTGGELRAGARLTVKDREQPAQLELAEVLWESDDRLRLRLSHDSWRHPTECVVALNARGQGSTLTVNHVGWEGTGGGDEPLRQRRRFSELWVAACERARSAVEEAGRG